jgi:hypothetical protein
MMNFGAEEMEAVWLEWVVHRKWSVAKRAHKPSHPTLGANDKTASDFETPLRR